MEAELARQRHESAELARVARLISETLDLTTVGQRIAESVLGLREVHSSAIRLCRPDGTLEAIALGGRAQEYASGQEIVPEMKYHDRIFGIFERRHRQEDYPGTGVGLAIVRKVAERHHGRAWATSASGRGSVFFLAIPAGPVVDD